MLIVEELNPSASVTIYKTCVAVSVIECLLFCVYLKCVCVVEKAQNCDSILKLYIIWKVYECDVHFSLMRIVSCICLRTNVDASVYTCYKSLKNYSQH